MPYELVHKMSFDDDLIALPFSVQKKVVTALRRLREDPFRAGGKVKKIAEHRYTNLYRYRIDDYRIVYAVGTGVISLIRVGHRSKVYDMFYGDPEKAVRLSGDLRSADPQPFITTSYDKIPDHLPDGSDNCDDESDIASSAGEEIAADVEAEDEFETPVESGRTSRPSTLLEEFLKVWRVPEEYHDAILSCKTPDQVLSLDIPDHIKEMLMLWKKPTLEQIHEQPNLELREPEDIERFLDGSLKRFLLKLDPEQEKAASRSLHGPVLAKGGPGTGKSLVALYRIRNLMTPEAQKSLFGSKLPSVLLVTFGTSLAEACRQLLEDLLGGVPETVNITNLDKIVKAIIAKAGEKFQPATEDQKKGALAQALKCLEERSPKQHSETALSAIRKLRPEYLLEEFDWVIEGRCLRSLDEYLREDRTGRGTPLDQKVRAAIWDLHRLYVENLAEEGRATWDIYRDRACSLLRENPDLHARYDAVIIDEAQDLTPAGLSVCVELCNSPAGLYLTADANQSIYNRGFAWSRVHEALKFRGRAVVLKRNYRSTREIANAAVQILRDYSDSDPEVYDAEPVHVGPKPVIFECGDSEEQYERAAEFLKESARELMLPVWSGAVLVPSNKAALEAEKYLNGLGIPAKAIKGSELNLDEPVVKVMTIHTAKGLEFPIVVVARVDNDQIPGIWKMTDEAEIECKVAADRRLLFVALSRAMRRLAVTCTRWKRSRFIDELDRSLWTTG